MMNQNQQATILPIDRKMLLSIREAAEYSNIGINKIDEMLKQPNCPFVLYVGTKKLVKRNSLSDIPTVFCNCWKALLYGGFQGETENSLLAIVSRLFYYFRARFLHELALFLCAMCHFNSKEKVDTRW